MLMQGTKKMTRQYVERQISLFQQKSPKRARDKMEYVIVVGASGNVHRHKLNEQHRYARLLQWRTLSANTNSYHTPTCCAHDANIEQ